MKIFLFLIGLVAAGIIGYSFEPQMRFQLTGKTQGSDKPSKTRSLIVQPGSQSATIDPTVWPVERLPEKVTLKAEAEIANEAGDIRMTVTAGNRVDLVRLEGQNVIISPGPGPFQGSVPVVQTDLVDQLTELAKNPPEVIEPDPVEPAETPEEPEEVMPEPTVPEVAVVEPEPEPEPEPQPEPEPEPAAPEASSDVVAVMQSSIKDGQIKEFTFDQVLDWQADEEPETIDGETYRTGIASYKAETVFGVKTIQAKALIKDGKVVRWLWPKSGMEIN